MKKLAMSVILLIVLVLCGTTIAEWTPPQPVVNGINTSVHEFLPFLSFDGKTLYFSRGDGHHYDIWQATREGTSGPFTSVTKALARGSYWCVLGPWVSPDNLRMYYHDEGNPWHLRVSTRASVNDPWTLGTTIPGLSSFTSGQVPKLSQDELTIVFDAYNAPNSYDLYIATRPNINSPFGNIRNLSELNSSAGDQGQFLTPDGLTLYFNSGRNGINQIFKATRQSLNDPFGNLERLSFFDTPYGSVTPSLSADGSTLFFAKGMPGTNYGDIYVSNLIIDPVTLAIMRINTAIDGKIKAIEIIDSAMEKENQAVTALNDALQNKEYGDLTRVDIIKAKMKIAVAKAFETNSKIMLDKSIDKLEEALETLGIEPDPNLPLDSKPEK